MNEIIIPYDDSLGKSDGAFIRPDGKILHVHDNKHEEYAEEYCNGHDFPFLTGTTYGPSISIIPFLDAQQEVKKIREGIDAFQTTNLTRQELELYKKWLITHSNPETAFYADFLVYALAYDKVETLIKNVITTTAAEPHVRFYNFYLMDWHIYPQKRMVFDEEKNLFVSHDSIIEISDENDREAEEEIEEIKRKVLLKERPYFFK